METITVTLTGKSLGDIAAQAMTFAQTAQGGVKLGAAPTTPKAATKKTAAPPVVEDDLEGLEASDADETTEEILEAGDDLESFDDAEELEEAPVKKTATKAAATKTPKITEKDINTAALAHAKKHTRPETLKLLKKLFKVASVSEIKPTDYPAAIKALKV